MVGVNSYLTPQIPPTPPPKEWNPNEVRERTLLVETRPWNPSEPRPAYNEDLPEDWKLVTTTEHDGEQQLRELEPGARECSLKSHGLTAVHELVGGLAQLEKLVVSKNLIRELPAALLRVGEARPLVQRVADQLLEQLRLLALR